MDHSDAQQADRRAAEGFSLARGENARSGAEQLGPYALIAEISTGEFTTVHLAHKRGAHGFDRLVAIKRLKPEFARQPEWSQLLLDEARLGASVDHPHTVDILDVGTDAGVYVVMDYVEGADLEQLLTLAGRERHPRFVLPPLLDALAGLHAIHTQKDELGEPLAMVHQAPRARHILVGIHGTARVTDFSQVTARGLIPSTLRGKGLSPAYMAPEQVLVSEPVSARTDVFIVGITLWEALTGKRLFVGDTPSLVRRAITERDIPKPSEVGLHPARCFDAIVMRALQRNPELRYPSAAELARELRAVAQEEALLATASEVGQWVRALASRTLLERRHALGVDDRSVEIAVDALERQLAVDRATEPGAPPSFEGASSEPADEKAQLVQDHELSVVEPEQVTPAITVPVTDAEAAVTSASIATSEPSTPKPSKLAEREPTQTLSTPSAAPRRSLTGTLIGVASKPRSVGLPPPATAALHAKLGSVPPYRGSLGRTALEAPRGTQPAAKLAANRTLPEGGAFIRDLELPIDLPAAPSDSGRSFVGFTEAIDADAEPATLRPPAPKAPASFGGAAALPSSPLRSSASSSPSSPSSSSVPSSSNGSAGHAAPRTAAARGAASDLRVTQAYGSPAADMPPLRAPSTPPPIPDAARVPNAAPAAPVQAWSQPVSTPANAPSATSAWSQPAIPPPPSAPAASGATRPSTAAGSSAPRGSSARDRSEDSRRSEPPARPSRPSILPMLDGSVPDEVFERLRTATAARADSLRPPAEGSWAQDKQAEPHGYGRILAIAAAVALAGFFAYQQLTADARHPLPPPVRNAGSAAAAPVFVPQTSPAPSVESLRPTIEASPGAGRAQAEVAPAAPATPSALAAGEESARPKRAVPHARREESPAAGEARGSSSPSLPPSSAPSREPTWSQPASPAPAAFPPLQAPRAAQEPSPAPAQPAPVQPTPVQPAVQELLPASRSVAPVEARPAEPRPRARPRSEGLPDNPY